MKNRGNRKKKKINDVDYIWIDIGLKLSKFYFVLHLVYNP